MALFEQLPNDLILKISSSLKFNFEELRSLRFVCRAWKQAVEEGIFGDAGNLHKKGLAKFACRIVDQKRDPYSGLGILNNDGTMLHIHPMMSGRFGITGLPEDMKQEEGWVDVPESMVVVNSTLYILSVFGAKCGASHPTYTCNPNRCFEWKSMKLWRLRSWHLLNGNRWINRSPLRLSIGELPWPSGVEILTLTGSEELAAQSSFTVVASQRYIFVMHFNTRIFWHEDMTSDSSSVVQISSVHGNLYDTLDDAWMHFRLPAELPEVLELETNQYGTSRGPDMRHLLNAAASREALYLKTKDHRFYVHSLKPEELDHSWRKVALKSEDGGAVRFEETYSMSATSAYEVNQFSVLGKRFEGQRVISTFREDADQHAEGDSYAGLKVVCYTLAEEVPWKTPSCRGADGRFVDEQLHFCQRRASCFE